MAIKIILSSAHMGDVDELDFDLWARFVTGNLDEGVGIDVDEVDQFRFGEAGEDRIEGATEEQRLAIRSWLSVTGWVAFCGETWKRMRSEAEAAA